MTRRLFVCHATADIEATSELVDALENALNFANGSIWTSSLPGYSADSNDMPALGAALAGSDVVLALVTEGSVRDAQFHFQLGAAWALGAHTVLYVLESATQDELPNALSQAPAMRGHEQWSELIGDLSVRLGLVPRPGASYPPPGLPAVSKSDTPPAAAPTRSPSTPPLPAAAPPPSASAAAPPPPLAAAARVPTSPPTAATGPTTPLSAADAAASHSAADAELPAAADASHVAAADATHSAADAELHAAADAPHPAVAASPTDAAARAATSSSSAAAATPPLPAAGATPPLPTAAQNKPASTPPLPAAGRSPNVPPLPAAASGTPTKVPPLSAAASVRPAGVPPLPTEVPVAAAAAATAKPRKVADTGEPPTTPKAPIIVISAPAEQEQEPVEAPSEVAGTLLQTDPYLEPPPRAAAAYPVVAPPHSYLDELRAIAAVAKHPADRSPPRYSYIDELRALDEPGEHDAIPVDDQGSEPGEVEIDPELEEPDTREQLRVPPRQTGEEAQADRGVPAAAEQASDSDVFARLPTCEMALEAGRAVSDCVFNRDEIDNFAAELDVPLGLLIECLGASWVELRGEQDLDTWVAVTDHLLQTLPDEVRKVEEWYRVGYELATLHNLAGQLVLDGSDAAAEQHWRGALERFLMRAERAEIGYENLGRVLGLLENLVGPSHERDLSNIPRSLEELRRYAAGADIHTAA